MSFVRLLSAGLVVFCALKAEAALPPDSAPSTLMEKRQPLIPIDGIYRFDRNLRVQPTAVAKNGLIYENRTQDAFKFSQGEPVAIQIGLGGEVVLTPLMTPEESEALPEQYIFDLDVLNNLTFDREGDRETLVQNYSAYLDTAFAGRPGASRARRHGKIGNCARYVKSKLGFSRGEVSGNGKDMYSALRNRGFQTASCSSPSVGTVASWRGGWHGYGHAGIWNGRCWEYDRGCLKGGPGKGYSLIGCVARRSGSKTRYASR